MHRVEQFFGHLTARVGPHETEFAHGILPAGSWPLFEAMPVADRRHALDVVQRLLAGGHDDPDLMAAALLHDAAKGHRVRLWHRVAGVMLEAAAPRLLARLGSVDQRSARYPFHLYLHHAEISANAALVAGCSGRTAALIRGQASSDDVGLAAALAAADEAS